MVRPFQACMGAKLDNFRHNMESIRNTMQMHEDIFKHQVRELHRLYSVQKILMDELRKKIKKNRFWTATPMMTTSTSFDIMNQSQFMNQNQLTTHTTSGFNLHVQGDPRSTETSGDGNFFEEYPMKIARDFDLERPAGEAATVVEEDQAGPSSRNNQMMSNEGFDEDSDTELTLSIGIGGSSSSKKMLKKSTSSQSVHKEITRELDSLASCSGPNTPMSSSSATIDHEESKLPHWIFKGFSINRT